MKELEAELYNKEFIDKQKIKEFLDSLKYPLYFLDFETMQLVIPEFVGTHPYQQIAFQYSLHILDKPNGTLTHKEYLGESGKNPMEGLAKQLCEDITEDSTVDYHNLEGDVHNGGEAMDLFPKIKDMSKEDQEKARKDLLNISFYT